MRFIKSFFVSCFFILTLFSCFKQDIRGQQISPLWGELPDGNYAVGYKSLDEKDASRSFAKKSGDLFTSGARQIRISLWYPARDSGKPKMKFREYSAAMETETGAAAEAIRIFKLNVEAFPRSADAYDSLAQAYAFAGDSEQAKLNYKKSLELNPNNENAKARLKRPEEKK